VSKDLDSNLIALDKIRAKYSIDYSQLTSGELKEHECWERRMIIHKSILNKNIISALRQQLLLLFFSPSFFNFASLLVMLLGTRAVFTLKAKIN
jgi:hypothetical protein